MEEFMEEGQPIEFVVGETYENEKGVFEVMSVQRDVMVIQWENGESIETTVTFQCRVQERRRWERQMKEKKAAALSSKARRASARKPGATFEGFSPDDFKKTISRTPWRSRSQFGGAVTTRLQSSRLIFNSWAAKRRNEVHWADMAQWKAKTVDYPAKFFAHADEKFLSWGFYIERPDSASQASPDWEAFTQWLRNDENEKWLREIAREEGLVAYDGRQRSFSGLLVPREGDWAVEGSPTRTETDRLITIIEAWPTTAWLDFMIAKRIPKEEAIARGKEIAADAAALFGQLFPLYEAAL